MFCLNLIAARIGMHSQATDAQRAEIERQRAQGGMPAYGQPITKVEVLADGTERTTRSLKITEHKPQQ